MNFQHIKPQKFTREHIPQFLLFCYDAYLAGTNIYEDTPQARQSFNEITKTGLLQFIEAAQVINSRRGTDTFFNFFFRIDGKMVGAFFYCELHYFFKELVAKQHFQTDLYKDIPFEKILQVKQYAAVFAFRVSIRPQYQSSGLFNYASSERKKIFMRDGYQYGYGMTRNPKIIGFYKKNKGEIIYSYFGQFMSKTIQRFIVRQPLSAIPDSNGIKAKL